jgi:hypothetical protein
MLERVGVPRCQVERDDVAVEGAACLLEGALIYRANGEDVIFGPQVLDAVVGVVV